MTLFERVTFTLRHDALKHDLLTLGQTLDDYLRDNVNAMSPLELLEAISDALEEEKIL